jgi:hypothetical protein
VSSIRQTDKNSQPRGLLIFWLTRNERFYLVLFGTNEAALPFQALLYGNLQSRLEKVSGQNSGMT